MKKSSESAALRFLYGTLPGRLALRFLVHPKLSRAAGHFLDSAPSRLLIDPFIKSNAISLRDIDVPRCGFASFNDFFSRKRRASCLQFPETGLCSPCDGLLSCYKIDQDSRFFVKQSCYSLSSLLKSHSLAQHYEDGYALIFRLTPAHYHRYHYIDDAVCLASRSIPGVLHTVRPIAVGRVPVYHENSRTYSLLQTAHFGRIVQMEIGAMLVGKICNHPVPDHIRRGMEKGYFAYGGSTILLLIEKDRLQISDHLLRISTSKEIPVRLGDPLSQILEEAEKLC